MDISVSDIGNNRRQITFAVNKAYDDILPFAAEKLSISTQECRKDIEQVMILHKPTLSAGIGRRNSTGKYVIQVDISLIKYYFEMVKLINSQKSIRLPSGDFSKKSIPYQEAVVAAKRLMDGYLAGDVYSFGVPNEKMASWAFPITVAISELCVCFTIAHELGHYVQLKLLTPPEEYVIASNMVGFLVRSTLAIDSKEIVKNWTTEVAADIMGFQFLMHYVSTKSDIHQIFAYHSCEMALSLYGLIAYYKYGNDMLAYTCDLYHPPLVVRRGIFRDIGDQNGFHKPLQEAQWLFDTAIELVASAKGISVETILDVPMSQSKDLTLPNRLEAILECNKGHEFYEKKEYKSAVECYKRAIKINPNYARAYSNMGTALYGLGQYDDGRKCYLKAIEIDSDDGEALYNCGYSLASLGEYNESILFYDASIKSFKKSPNEQLKLSRSFNMKAHSLQHLGHWEEAIGAWEEAKSLDQSRCADLTFNIGRILLGNKRYGEAAKRFALVVKLRPNDAEALCNYGIAQHNDGKFNEGSKAIAKAIEMEPKLADKIDT